MNARDYLSLVRERKLLIAACIVLCVAAAAVITSLVPKVYTSTATYYVVAGATSQPQASPSSDSYQGAQLALARVKSYKELITGLQVATEASDRLGSGVTPAQVQAKVTASSVEETVVFSIAVSDNSALGAKQTADAISQSFLGLVDELERPTFGDAQPAVRTKVVQEPTTPVVATNPQPKVNLVIGFVIGLLLGLGIAIGRRSLDVSVRTGEALEAATGVPTLGTVPEDRHTGDEPVALAARDGRGPSERSAARAEAYRRIRTALDHANRRVLVVVGAQPGDGVSITACNLAAAFAAIGAKVALVDANLRDPMTARYLRLEERAGLTDVLTGEVGIWHAMQTWEPGRFDILSSGRDVERPNELLSSPQVRRLFSDLRSRYDYVIIDAAPFRQAVDAANLGANADGAVVVARCAKTSRYDAESVVEFLRSLSIPVVGSLLSRTPSVARDDATRTRRLGRRRSSSPGATAAARAAAATAAVPTTAIGFPKVSGPAAQTRFTPVVPSPTFGPAPGTGATTTGRSEPATKYPLPQGSTTAAQAPTTQAPAAQATAGRIPPPAATAPTPVSSTVKPATPKNPTTDEGPRDAPAKDDDTRGDDVATKAAGTKAAGTKAAGTKAAGTKDTGTKATDTKAADTTESGTKESGTEDTGATTTAVEGRKEIAEGATEASGSGPRSTPKSPTVFEGASEATLILEPARIAGRVPSTPLPEPPAPSDDEKPAPVPRVNGSTPKSPPSSLRRTS